MYGNKVSRQQKKGLSILRGNSLQGRNEPAGNPQIERLKNMSSSPAFKRWLEKNSK